MIGQSVKLTRIRGIDVGVHYSWFIVFALITFSLTARFASEHPHWALAEHYLVGIATSLLFFSSILVHELAHSFVALAKGIPVRSITLFVFGGVAQIGREPDRPMTEFQIAIAGPLASALLAVGFGAIAYLADDQFEHLSALAGWLSSINLMLALFNLVPGFPLDGGADLSGGPLARDRQFDERDARCGGNGPRDRVCPHLLRNRDRLHRQLV
jgi:Zn-dependent protease